MPQMLSIYNNVIYWLTCAEDKFFKIYLDRNPGSRKVSER